MIRVKWFLHLITFICFLNEGFSLICYSCSASIGHDAACENITEHLSDISHHKCFYNDAVCATYKIKHDSDIILYRSCRNSDVCFSLSKRYNSQYNQLLDCQTCNDDDLCNSSVAIYPRLTSVNVFLVGLISIIGINYCVTF